MEFLSDLADALGDEAFTEYRAVGSKSACNWWASRLEAERDAEDLRRNGEERVRIQRRVCR
jgi:hypothetical protein